MLVQFLVLVNLRCFVDGDFLIRLVLILECKLLLFWLGELGAWHDVLRLLNRARYVLPDAWRLASLVLVAGRTWPWSPQFQLFPILIKWPSVAAISLAAADIQWLRQLVEDCR